MKDYLKVIQKFFKSTMKTQRNREIKKCKLD